MNRLFSSLALCMAFIVQPAQATFTDDCNTVLNGAQQSFAGIFPGNPPNQFFGNWCFRSYPGVLLAGITSGDSDFQPGVYVMGPPFANTPTFVGTVNEVLVMLGLPADSGSSDQAAICDTSNNEASGIIQTQEDNKIKITTNGQCVKPPKNNSFCEVSPETDDDGGFVETGIHALTTTDVNSVIFSGFDIPDIPGIPGFSNPLESIVDSFASKTCIIHAPEEISNFEIETDICLDLTDEVKGIPGVMPPVTVKFQGLSTMEIVNDCFQTDADSITNLVTEQIWIRQNGNFVEIN